IDFDLVKEWIKCCENWHGKSCDLGDHISFNESGEFLVVDAVEGCLVNIPCSARYVALSYVWGGAKTLATCKDNVDKLMRPGALFSRLDEISRTRRDAINLIPLIGERYVWIDVLCMVQDDPDMNKILVNQMDKIYQNAVCTVVVAVGNDANVALPAISTDS
ncbi:HET-domain-containing protein, partial [Lojkania enalia]